MAALYFLDGLGSNRYYAADFLEALAGLGLSVTYLPLPGHPDNLASAVTGASDLLVWLDQALPTEPVVLLGYSLGADLVAGFAAHYPERVTALILLDGACHDLEAHPLDQELAGARAYLEGQVFEDMAEHLAQVQAESPCWSAHLIQAEEEAYAYQATSGVYRLNLVEETVLGLLTARAELGMSLQGADFVTPTTVIISDQPEVLLLEREAVLKQAAPCVRYEVFPNSDHSFYLTFPQELASRVQVALEELTNA